MGRQQWGECGQIHPIGDEWRRREVVRGARVAAVNAGEYALRRVRGGSVVDGGGVVMGTADDHDPRGRSGTGDKGGCGIVRVDDDNDVPLGRTLYAASYSKGMEGRGMYEERAEIIGLTVLRCVLELVYNANP
jgi:hypothetical protein